MRAVIYCRVSTTEQAQTLSLATQEESCREYCARHGYDIDHVFVDAGESAKTAERPEFQKMLAHCRRGRGKLHALVVYSLTRFSRNSADHHAIAGLLRGVGIALRSVTEPIDDSPSGKLMEGILAAMAQFDNDVRSERVTAGMKAAVSRGRWVWPAPLGYKNANHKGRSGPSLEHDPDRADSVREAFRLCASGVTGAALLQRVRKLGLRTQFGRIVSESRLYEMLRHPVYMGVIRHKGWNMDVAGDWPAIVDEHTFARAQAQLSQPVPPGPPPNATRLEAEPRPIDGLFPLRRFARCSSCGRRLTGSSSRSRNGSKHPFYHCTLGCVRLPKAALEQQFIELLAQLRPHPAVRALLNAKVLESWRSHVSQARERRGTAQRRIAELEQKLQRLDELFIYQQAIDTSTYQTQRDKLRETIVLERLKADEADGTAVDVESRLAFAQHVLDHAESLWTIETCTSRRTALQWALFPAGITVAKTGKIEPPVTCLEFFELTPRVLEASGAEKGLVDHPAASWNRAAAWLSSFDKLKAA